MKKIVLALFATTAVFLAVAVPVFVLKGDAMTKADEARQWRSVAESLLANKPYFGEAMAAGQSRPERLRHFPAAIAAARQGDEIRILEIGSWAGESTIAWAEAATADGHSGSVTCIDPWLPYFDENVNGAPWYKEMNRAAENSSIYNLFLHNIRASGFSQIIKPLVGTTAEIAPSLASDSFHLIFVDGSHAYQDVAIDLRESRRLVLVGGLICGDDLEKQASELDPDSLRFAAESGRDTADGYHPGVTRAVAEAFGSVAVYDGFWCTQKQDDGWEPANLYHQ